MKNGEKRLLMPSCDKLTAFAVDKAKLLLSPATKESKAKERQSVSS